ncbi:hypothetical protein [Mesorhizobium sp. M0011]|uniref:hypothetical protein n=1 Tax=Mesorhizobium sp. M0011 TaxID=2956839 RepID=UPI0033385B08
MAAKIRSAMAQIFMSVKALAAMNANRLPTTKMIAETSGRPKAKAPPTKNSKPTNKPTDPAPARSWLAAMLPPVATAQDCSIEIIPSRIPIIPTAIFISIPLKLRNRFA